MHNLKAIKVREDNIDYIVEYAREREMNLDYIKDNMEYNALDGVDTYVVTDEDPENPLHCTFTDMTDYTFRTHWKFKEHENPNIFVPIERA